MVRVKIRASMIIHRLHKCVMGEVILTPAQVAAAKALLDKSVSDAPKDVNVNTTGKLTLSISLSNGERRG